MFSMDWGERKAFIKSSCLFILLVISFVSCQSASFLSKGPFVSSDDLQMSKEKVFELSLLLQGQDEDSRRYYQETVLQMLLVRYQFFEMWYDKDQIVPSFILHNCTIVDQSQDNPPLACFLELYAPTEHSRMLQFLLEHPKHNSTKNSTLKYSDVLVKVLTPGDNSSSVKIEKTCHSDLWYYFINKRTMKPFNYTFDNNDNLAIQIALLFGDCKFDMVTPIISPSRKEDPSLVLKYTLMMIGIAVFQMIACVILIRKLVNNSSVYKRMSIGSICFLIVFDFFIYLLHFSYWTSISMWYAVVFITFFIIAVFIEPVLLYYLFSALQRRTNHSILYILFQIYAWIIISGGCIILSLTCIPNFIFYAYPFFLLPQIVDNFLSGRKYRWNFLLIAGLGLPKLFYIVYLSMDPVDLFRKGFTNEMTVYSCVVLAISFVILLIQSKYPTFNIKRFHRAPYSYLCNLNDINHSILDVCSICTEKVSQPSIMGLQQPLLEQENENPEIYKTPCDHHFHSECLKEWLKKKLECPNCRQGLPALPDEEDED